ncbi:hypothetical protein HMSSN139_28610 [Paenibacillus sp. HMSSN-139]|nr:hypothetical protein HMSSN139_28610 [Paenibacillus sp. HMSSN-139]
MKMPMRMKSKTKAVPKKESGAPTRNDRGNELLAELSGNEQVLKQIFANSSDIQFRSVTVPGQTRLLLVYVDGLINENLLDQVVLQPMMFEGLPGGSENAGSLGTFLEERLVAVAQVKPAQKIGDLVEGILKGDIAMLIDGEQQALLAGLKGFEKRAIEEPSAELSVRGPRDGFTESLRTNTSLIRRRFAARS